jgi:hypothetical protein
MEVHITDQLDPDLDWSTYEITGIQIGDVSVPVPAGTKTLTTTVPAVVKLKDFNDPNYPNVAPQDTNVNIEVNCLFNGATGLAEWHFVGRHPSTGELADFLPPNVFEDDPGTPWDDIVAPDGEGWASYCCRPKADLPSGTVIENQASIVFDVNPPMVTDPVVFNTIDADTPSSEVAALAAESPAEFTVEWSGEDEPGGSGVGGYDVHVSDDGAPYQLWLGDTPDTSASYTGEHGHVYRFFSLARDNVGHLEAWPADADAETTVADLSHNIPTAGYYMISFPALPPSATVHETLCDDLGDAPGTYYMWRWNGTSYETIPTTPPGCQTATLSSREGYWILTTAAPLEIDAGALASGDQVIPLHTGWNITAVPFGCPMDDLRLDNAGDVRSLAQAQSAGWILATFYGSHDGTGSYNMVTIGQRDPDELSVWEGYWVLAGIDCSLIIPAPLGSRAPAGPRAARASPAWAFDIHAASAGSMDTITIAGAESASDDFDGFAWDKPKPPVAPGAGRLRMVLAGEGWRGTPRLPSGQAPTPPYNKARGGLPGWASELAMETKAAGAEASEYQFTVAGGVAGEAVTLMWPDLSRLPKDRVAILTDLDTGKRTFMRSRAHCEIPAPGAAARSLTVTVKAADQGALLVTGLTAIPTRSGTWDIGFSLTSEAAVTARVHNVAGRLVASVAESQQLARGRASVTWNARSTTGTHVPSGVYLLRVTARTEEGEQASVVTMLQVRR